MSPTTKRKLSILAEVCGRCNLSCPMCPIDDVPRPLGHMSLRLWEKILNEASRDGHIIDFIHHLGEPLMWKHFDEGMRLWSESGLMSQGKISTNGVLLDSRKIDVLSRFSPKAVRVCIDSMDPEVHSKARSFRKQPNRKHTQILESIRLLARSAKNLTVEVQIMNTQLNPNETPDAVFTHFQDLPNLAVFHTSCIYLGGDRAMALSAPSPDRSPSTCNKLDYEHCVIGWGGTVTLCCVDYACKNKLGRLTEDDSTTVYEIYCGHRADTIRQQVRRGDFSQAAGCAGCTMEFLDYTGHLVSREDDCKEPATTSPVAPIPAMSLTK